MEPFPVIYSTLNETRDAAASMCEVREDFAKTDNEILSRIGAGGMREVRKGPGYSARVAAIAIS